MLKFPFDMNLTLEFGGFNNNDITERIPKREKLENCNVKKKIILYQFLLKITFLKFKKNCLKLKKLPVKKNKVGGNCWKCKCIYIQ